MTSRYLIPETRHTDLQAGSITSTWCSRFRILGYSKNVLFELIKYCLFAFLIAIVASCTNSKTDEQTYPSNAEITGMQMQPAKSDSCIPPEFVDCGPNDLNYSDLSQLNLSGANLAGLHLMNVDFSGSNLSGANLKGAFLMNSDLTNAILEGADLSQANFENAILRNAKLSNSNLLNAYMWGSDLSYADLSSANLSGANLTKTVLLGANFYKTDLTKTNVTCSMIIRDAKNLSTAKSTSMFTLKSCNFVGDSDNNSYSDEDGYGNSTDYGDDSSPDDYCRNDCNDMDNDGRTWDDYDADGDGLYETP
jgi:uncharacterized protein YjbI with pentapeptide repeats